VFSVADAEIALISQSRPGLMQTQSSPGLLRTPRPDSGESAFGVRSRSSSLTSPAPPSRMGHRSPSRSADLDRFTSDMDACQHPPTIHGFLDHDVDVSVVSGVLSSVRAVGRIRWQRLGTRLPFRAQLEVVCERGPFNLV
jgi:hypothetical protein